MRTAKIVSVDPALDGHEVGVIETVRWHVNGNMLVYFLGEPKVSFYWPESKLKFVEKSNE